MRLAYAGRRVTEVFDVATHGMERTLHGSVLAMRRPGSGNGDAHRLDIRRPLHITLRDGFRGHAVVILVDGKAVYHRAGLTTDASTSRADAVDLVVASRQIEVAVSVTPGMEARMTADGLPGYAARGRVVEIMPRMSFKQVWTDRPDERFDVKTREVLVEVLDEPAAHSENAARSPSKVREVLVYGLPVEVELTDSRPDMRTVTSSP